MVLETRHWLPVALLLGCSVGGTGCGERRAVIALHAPEAAADGAVPEAGPATDAGGGDAAGDASLQDAGRPESGAADAGARDAGARDAARPPGDAAALQARYDFAGTGTRIVDRAGDHDGVALGGTELSGDGHIRLDGQDDYIDLPNGIFSRLESATLMVWFEWEGGPCWQRVFDFGNSDQGEDRVGNVVTSLFLTPAVCGGRNGASVLVELGPSQYGFVTPQALPVDRWLHVTLTLDPPANRMRMYVDGELLVETAFPFTLAQIEDENVWLGRSQWVQDYHLHGRYDEFRLYGRALGAREVRDAYQRGPDAP